MVPISEEKTDIPAGTPKKATGLSPPPSPSRFPSRRRFLSRLLRYKPLVITMLAVAFVTGASYYLARLREEQIEEEAARPLPPLPKPATPAAPAVSAPPAAEPGDEPAAPAAEEAPAEAQP
jgi:hypothetical protein